MPVDTSLLREHASYVDERLGIEERFLQPLFGTTRSVAVLARPARPTRRAATGWAICHSFGMEQIHLQRLEVAAARALARAGFTTLRFHGRGYGDSAAAEVDIGLGSHLEDAASAVDLLQAEGGKRVGVLGGRFGGTVATLTADRLALPLLAVWEPVVDGSRFVRELLRSQLLYEMVEGPAGAEPSAASPAAQLADRGWADVKGLRLARDATEEMRRVDLVKDVERFDGTALVLSVSKDERPTGAASRLTSRLRELGARCDEEVVTDRAAPQFGQHHHSNRGGATKTDTQFELAEAVVAATVRWAEAVAGAAEEDGAA